MTTRLGLYMVIVDMQEIYVAFCLVQGSVEP